MIKLEKIKEKEIKSKVNKKIKKKKKKGGEGGTLDNEGG
jgi:hypothetical protein